MVLNFSTESKPNKSNSKLQQTVTITNDGRAISWKSIKSIFKKIVKQYDLNPEAIAITAMGDRNRTIKQLGEDDMYDTVDDYFENKVKDPDKFSNNFTSVKIRIY